MTGLEPAYDPARWNRDIAIAETHNCYSYAMNVNDPKQMAKCRGKKECDAPFHQPGAASKYPPFRSDKPKTCPNLLSRIRGDNPNVVLREFEQRCPAGTSKIALVIDQSDDYHFLRQDKGGYWSQKSGARPVTDLDAGKHRIWDPQLADANFSNHEGVLNYDVFCGYLCVPRKKPVFMHIGGSKRSESKRSESKRGESKRAATKRSATSRAAAAYAEAKPFRTALTRRRS